MRKDPVDIVSATLEPTERCGVLDQVKKDLIIVLINRGASRREAAAYVKCHHTTIGRTAARDPAFAAKLSQTEMAGSLATNGMIRRAATEPKYWRAAAWMLERRNPEDYGKRSPNTYTCDQVVSLIASICSGAVKVVPADKIEEFYGYFDDSFDEIELKQGNHPAPRDAAAAANKTTPNSRDERPIPSASQNGRASNGQAASQNGHATDGRATNGTAPSTNGHRPPETPPAAEAAAVVPTPPVVTPEAASVRLPSEALSNGNGAGPLSADSAIEVDADESDSLADEYDGDTFTDDDLESDPGDDDSDDDDFIDDFTEEDWERYEELQDSQDRYVSAEQVPDPVERRAANRAVRLSLAAARLRSEMNPNLMHHPINRVVGSFGGDASRKPLPDMDLRLQPMARTSEESAKGRCMNDIDAAVSEALKTATVAATSP
jgi:hypothetical protein